MINLEKTNPLMKNDRNRWEPNKLIIFMMVVTGVLLGIFGAFVGCGCGT